MTLLNVAGFEKSCALPLQIPSGDLGSENLYESALDPSADGPVALCLSVDSLQLPKRIAVVKIESDEDGFHLIVELDDWIPLTPSGRLSFNIHAVAGELLAEVKREIEPWWTEGQAVLASMQADGEIPGDDAYPLYDQKHPDFHENFSALSDNREA